MTRTIFSNFVFLTSCYLNELQPVGYITKPELSISDEELFPQILFCFFLTSCFLNELQLVGYITKPELSVNDEQLFLKFVSLTSCYLNELQLVGYITKK